MRKTPYIGILRLLNRGMSSLFDLLRKSEKGKKITILRKNVIFEAETVTVRKRQFGSVTHTTT